MSLTPHDIARMLDHSTLQPFLTEDDIRRGCELALKYDTASVCARPCDVPILAEMLRGSDVKVCTAHTPRRLRWTKRVWRWIRAAKSWTWSSTSAK